MPSLAFIVCRLFDYEHSDQCEMISHHGFYLRFSIKRHLLLGRKLMTNLDRILKSRDITLQTKVHLVKAVVFPVVIYGCESWTIKKAECQKIAREKI